MHTQLSVEINRGIEEVFAKTNDDIVTWSQTCVGEELLAGERGVVGSRSRITTEENGRRMDFESELCRWEPPTLSQVYLTSKSFDIDVTYRFEAVGNGTRVTQESTIHGKGGFKVFLALFGWMMKRQGCKAQLEELNSLKTYCETGAPVS